MLERFFVLALTLGIMAASAAACGGGGAAATSLKTSLSGGGKEGEEITVSEGTGVKDTATLSGENASKATGTAKYAVYSDKECKTLVTNAGEVTVKEGKVPASEEKKLEAGAVYYWQAVYSGDTNNSASTSTCGKEVLTVKATTSLKTSLLGGGKEGEEIIVSEGSGVKDTATLSGTKSSTATGNVEYALYKDKECKELVSSAGKGALTEGKAAASEEEKPEAAAVYYWKASYVGDSLHEGTSTCGKEVLTVKATTTLKTLLIGDAAEGEVAPEGAEISLAEGEDVSDTASLSGTNMASATGSVDYLIYKDPKCKELVEEAGKGSVSGESAAASSLVELAAGTYYWRAVYSGDALHLGSTSNCGSEVLTVKAATTVSTLLSGEGLKGEEITVTEDATVSDTATLGGSKAEEATGKVKYRVFSDFECTELVADAGEATVSGKSVPASEAVELPAGTYFWRAIYSGDGANHGSSSPCGAEVEVVLPAITTALSAGGEAGEAIEAAEGTPVSDKATLHGEHAAEATGSVSYFVYSDAECEELATEAGKVTVAGASAPASEKVELEAGVYYWQAVYSGDGKNPPATSGCGVEVLVVTTATTLTTSLSGGEEEGAEVEVSEGDSVTDQGFLSGANVGAAEGTIEYNVYADSECEELAAYAGGGALEEGSIPPSSEVELPPGTYYWQAAYSGDGQNHEATSICGAEVEVVTAPITTQLSGGEQAGATIEVPEGTLVSDKATLHGEHAAEATGSVNYFVYSDAECEELATEAGKVTVAGASVPASKEVELEAGVYYWRAVYSGDGKNPPATSGCGVERANVTNLELEKYAAIGDSFSSGQGAKPYYFHTNHHVNQCHRSKEAWPALVAAQKFNEGVLVDATVFKQQPPSFIFRACSGAKLDNLWSSAAPAVAAIGGQFGEFTTMDWLLKPAQDLWLSLPGGELATPFEPNPDIRMVTVTIGGNDVGFTQLALSCLSTALIWLEAQLSNCQDKIDVAEGTGFGEVREKLPLVLNDIRRAAPQAQIWVLLYPNLFHLIAGRPRISVGLSQLNNTLVGAAGGRTAAQSLSLFIEGLDTTLKETVLEMEAPGIGVVDATVGALADHQFGDAVPWINGVDALALEDSLHPNRCGYIAIARHALPVIAPAVALPAAC